MEYTYTNFNNFQPLHLEILNNQIPDYKEIQEFWVTKYEYDYFKLIYIDDLLKQIKFNLLDIMKIFKKNFPIKKEKAFNRRSYKYIYL